MVVMGDGRRKVRPISSIRSDVRGVAAVEFALLVPLLLAMYAGLVELCEAMNANRKVNEIAVSTADLIAQRDTLSTSDNTDVMTAATLTVAPYDPSALKVLACVVYTNSSNVQVVRWCNPLNDTTSAPGAANPMPVPTNLMTSGEDMVVVRVKYNFSSPFSSLLAIKSGGYALQRIYYERPRISSTITTN